MAFAMPDGGCKGCDTMHVFIAFSGGLCSPPALIGDPRTSRRLHKDGAEEKYHTRLLLPHIPDVHNVTESHGRQNVPMEIWWEG